MAMKNLKAQGTLAMKVMTFQYLTWTMIVAQILMVWLSAKVALFPDGEAMMSIVTTCAQIIAGLYGITMAGYTFFLSRIDALMASDGTLPYIVESIKRRFKYLIWFLSGSVLMSLFTSILLMYLPVPEGENLRFFYRLFCNEFIFAVGISILLILYYSLLVIDPNSIEKEAEKLKGKLSPGRSRAGSVTAFIQMYDRIEGICTELVPANVRVQLRENKGNRFDLTISLLEERYPQWDALTMDIHRLHRYYCCVVNCNSLSVSQEMCDLAQNVLQYLEQQRGLDTF